MTDPRTGDLAALVLAGDGEMAARCRAFDWSATSLGPVERWSYSLRTTVGILLASRHPMFLFWGADHVQLYNDAYRPSLGEGGRHPKALGARGREFWTDIWDAIGPQIAQVMTTGEATWHEDQYLPILRNGHLEDVWWTYSYSPVRDDDGRINGTLVVCHETTSRMLAALRTQALNRELEAARDAANAERLVAEQVEQRAQRLQELTVALSAPLTRELAVRVILEQTVSTVGAIAGGVLAVSDDERDFILLDIVGYPDAVRRAFARFPIDAPTPGRDAFRERRPIFLGDTAEWAARGYPPPAADPVGRAGLPRAWAALPLMVDERVLGVLTLTFGEPRAFSADEQQFALAFARQCAQALDRARLYAAAQEARAQAEHASRAKSEFLAVMSHELRTPLNAIDGYAELMELGIRGPVTEGQREDLARIRKSQRHLLGLINEVLNYTRVEAGAVRYDLDDVPVDETLATCEALTAPQMRAKQLVFAYPSGDHALLVRADREKLQQIVLNLLTNAVKFTEPGGRVELRGVAAGDRVVITVTDTGRGIAADQLERVFEPFVQVDATRTRTQEGVGLGLAISRDLAHGMAGDLVAASVVGEGSTFTLTLPRA